MKKVILYILIISLVSGIVYSEDSLLTDTSTNESDTSYRDNRYEVWRIITTSLISCGALYYCSQEFKNAWGESNRSSWHWKTDDFQGDGFLQSDELSHFVAGQRVTQLGRAMALWTGVDEKTATIIGSGISACIAVWVEILDAYNPDQGFGTSDLVFGLAGIGFELTRLEYPIAKRFDLRVSFQRIADIPPSLIVAEDWRAYDNTIYWLTYQHDEKIPFDFALGYSTSRAPDRVHFLLPKREFYLGVGISGQELIRLIDRDSSNYVSGLLSWLEFAVYAKVYETEKIDVFD